MHHLTSLLVIFTLLRTRLWLPFLLANHFITLMVHVVLVALESLVVGRSQILGLMPCHLRNSLQVLIQLTVISCLTNVILVGILPRSFIHVDAQEVRMGLELMVIILSLVSHSKVLLLTLLGIVEIRLVPALELELLLFKHYVINW